MKDEELFFEAMQQMGVRRIRGLASDKQAPRPTSRQTRDPQDLVSADHREMSKDQQLFYEALQRIGSDLKDPSGEEERPLQTPPQKLRWVRNRPIQVEDSLDLHGHTTQEAKKELAAFVTKHAEKGTRNILIITGKGKNSPTGSVLKPLVISWIQREGSPFVKSWGTAPRMQGGEGALVLYLKKKVRNLI